MAHSLVDHMTILNELCGKIYTKLTKHIIKTASQLTNNQHIIDRAYQTRATFDTINAAFGSVHTLISHTDPITEDTIDNIKHAVDHYMNLYRRFFPNKVLPKHHILESHCIPFIERHKFGLGLLGEQGGELIHSTVSKLEKRTHAMRNETTQLKTVMQLSHLQTSPDLQSLVPAKKKRVQKTQIPH